MEGELVPSSASLYFDMRNRPWGWEGYKVSCRHKVMYFLLRYFFSIQALVSKPTAAMQQGGEICGLTWLSRPCHPWGHSGDRMISLSKSRSRVEFHLKTAGVRRDHKVMTRWKTTPFGNSFFGRKNKGWRRVSSWGGRWRSHLWNTAKRISGRRFQTFTPHYCIFSHDESWVRWTNPHGLYFCAANHPVLLFANVLTIRANKTLRCGWLCSWNHPTLSANQMGNNSVFTRKQVGNSTLHKRPFCHPPQSSSWPTFLGIFAGTIQRTSYTSWFASWKGKNRNLAFFLTAHCIKL